MSKTSSLLVLAAACTLTCAHAAPVYRMQVSQPGIKVSATAVTPSPAPATPAHCLASGTIEFTQAGDATWPVPSGCSEAIIKVWGAGGANSPEGIFGGAGAFVSAKLNLSPGSTLSLKIGAAGIYDATRSVSGGGGLSGVWLNNVPLLVAGSGGGAGKSPRGGAGGQAAEGVFAGQPGTATQGGSGCDGAVGSAWTGGVVKSTMSGHSAGSGGAGYFGGGGSCAIWWNSNYYGGAGGGGSNYVAPTLAEPVSLTGWYQSPAAPADPQRGAAAGPQSPGKIVISYR